MPALDCTKYFVIPLSEQKEGAEFLVGNIDIDEFYQFPKEGVRIIHLLQQGETVDAIKAACSVEFDDMPDVDEFVELLTEIGFIYREEDKHQFQNRLLQPQPSDGRIKIRANRRLARIVFSWPAFAAYLVVVGYAALSAVLHPDLRVNFAAFYIESNLTLTLVLLLVLYCVTVLMHELGHMLAAARYGIDSKLGLSNRLWAIVAEADLTGIFTLPKRKRYLPLIAGMMTDLLSISLLTILIQALMKLEFDTGGYTIHLLQALILQIIVTISWQFNVFLRTDLYYVICNHFSYPNLDNDARMYIRDRIHVFSRGHFGAKPTSNSYHQLNVLKAFAVIWIVGRIAAVGFLFFVVVPTLARYAMDAYQSFREPSVAMGAAIDLALFAFVSAIIFAAGGYMWLRRK